MDKNKIKQLISKTFKNVTNCKDIIGNTGLSLVDQIVDSFDQTNKKINLSFPNAHAFSIDYNDHRITYETVESWIGNNPNILWKNEDDKRKAIDTDTVWSIFWHPDTPQCSCSCAASSLKILLELANSYTKK